MSVVPRPTPAQPAAQFYCGIDWHNHREAALHIVNGRGEYIRRATVRADAGAVFQVLSAYLPHVVVGVESTTGAADLADELAAADVRCLIGDPAQLRFLNRNRRKSDRRDAESIALVLSSGTFPAIYHAPPAVRILREGLRLRSKFVDFRQGGRARVTGRNPYRDGFGVSGPRVARSPEDLIAACEEAADDGLTAPIDALAVNALREAERLFPEVFPRLTAIPGIGPLTAAIITAEVGDIERFARPDNLLSYARLVTPSDRSGGRIVRRGHPKAGNLLLRQAFLDAAHRTTQFCPHARAWFDRRFPTPAQVGAGLMAVARNLAEAVFVIWKRGVTYDPTRAFPASLSGRAM